LTELTDRKVCRHSGGFVHVLDPPVRWVGECFPCPVEKIGSYEGVCDGIRLICDGLDGETQEENGSEHGVEEKERREADDPLLCG
jgi:hypothetical protein